MTVVLRLDRVARVRGEGEMAVHALRGISLDVRAGELIAGMLVFEQDRVVDGTGSVEVSTVDSTTGAPARTRLVPVPAVVVARGPGQALPDSWLSPEAAQTVGVPVVVNSSVLQYDVPPSDDQEEAVSAALADLGETNLFVVERGYRDAYGDHATLAAVGADPRLRRRLTAFQAAVVPAVAALAAGLLTRSRLPLARRLG